MMDPIKRFTPTIDYYDIYRPSYPDELIDFIAKTCHLTARSKIADIGSGTGKLTKLLLQRHYKVYAVEPNQAMRNVAAIQLKKYPHFHPLHGTAENTALPDHSMDLITAAQAFHWFDVEKAKAEFLRILKPQGWIALVWNFRDNHASPLMLGYENLLQKFGVDYPRVAAENIDQQALKQFFLPNAVKTASYANKQIFDFDGLKSRMLSTSYLPKQGSKDFEPMMVAAQKLFSDYQEDGKVEFVYQSRVYYSQVCLD